MTRANTATISMSHQNGMLLVLSGAASAPPLYWPCQEMMPRPISHTGSHTADFQSSGGRCLSVAIEMPISMYPITSTTPSFQITSHPDQKMSRQEMTNAAGARNPAQGRRYGRLASGTCRRKAPTDSGAPAYISTLAPVMMPTIERQLGNGSRKTSPNRNAKMSPTHGTPLPLTRSKPCG